MVHIREKRPNGVTSTIDASGAGTVQALSGAGAVLAVNQSSRGFTPLELLDGALAGCLAISIRFSAKQHGWLDRIGEVAVTITHEKAAEGPSRVAGYSASYSFGLDLSEAERQILIAEAHHLCTVGNTLTHGAVIADL